MKKAQDNSLPMVQQGASMMMHAGTGANNVMIPEGYMLIPQGPAWPQPTVSAQLNTNYGKHHAKNQRRKARREQNAMLQGEHQCETARSSSTDFPFSSAGQ